MIENEYKLPTSTISNTSTIALKIPHRIVSISTKDEIEKKRKIRNEQRQSNFGFQNFLNTILRKFTKIDNINDYISFFKLLWNSLPHLERNVFIFKPFGEKARHDRIEFQDYIITQFIPIIQTEINRHEYNWSQRIAQSTNQYDDWYF